MTMPPPLAKHRRLFSSALAASAVAAVVLIASGLPDPVGAGPRSAVAATTTALAPAQVRVTRKTSPPPRIDPTAGRSGVVLYFLIEAARPQGMFGR